MKHNIQRGDSFNSRDKNKTKTVSNQPFLPIPVATSREFNHKNEKKLKPEKIYRFQCSGVVTPTHKSKTSQPTKVTYKAEFDRPVEEFIYPSLRPAEKEPEASTVRRVDFSQEALAASDRPNTNQLRWKFQVEEAKSSDIPALQTIYGKVEKGERYLREHMRTRYHGRVLAEAKEEEEKKARRVTSVGTVAIDTLNNRRENVLKSIGILKKPEESEPVNPDDVYYNLMSNHRMRMQRAVAKYVFMKPLERAHTELCNKLYDLADGGDSSLHNGVLYYQIQNELSQQKRNDELAKLTAAKVEPVKSEPQRLYRSMSSLQMRQMKYRDKRSPSSFISDVSHSHEDDSDDEYSDSFVNSMSELKVGIDSPLVETPTKLRRMVRAVNSSMSGYKYQEEVDDMTEFSIDGRGYTSCPSLGDQSVDGKKRHAQDILMLREIRAGVLPEQLLKKIPRMGNLISVDVSHFGLGDELGRCLGTSLCSLDMLHTLGLRGNRLTSASITVILENASNRSLRHLDLSMNDLRGGAVQSLCNVLSHPNSKLSSLEINKTNLGTSDIKKLCASLMKHETSWLLDWSLSQNMLESSAMTYIAEFLSYPGCSLNWFDLSWNAFDTKAGEMLASALSVNKSLSSINLAANSLRDEGGQHIAACLLGNQTLREIFLSLNNIGGKTCFIFSKVLRVHPNMERLDLSDNPLTEAGARSIFRTILRGLRCFVMMQNCTFNSEMGLFNHSNPSLDSPYDLDLSQPYQVAILSELINMVNMNSSCSFTSLSYKQSEKDTREYTVTAQHKNGETYLRAGSSPWAIPNTGILRVHFSHQVSIPTESMAIDELAFNTILAIVINARSENDRKNWLMLMCMDAYFTTSQAQDLIDILEDRRMIGPGGISKVDLFLSLWSNIIDTVNIFDFMYENLDADERINVEHSLTLEKFKFNWVNPTGHWRLDLANKTQRFVMMQLVAHNAVESKYSETKSRRGDTSQKGNWHNFRNERLNGKEVEIDVEYTKNIPWAGILEFDYVTTSRPATPGPPTITDKEFDILLKKLDLTTRRRLSRAKGNVRLLELQLAVTKYYFAISDVLSIMDCFSDDDSTQARVVIVMFNRIDELYNFDVILRHLSGAAVQEVFCRLGVLNCLNPLKPSHDYKFAMKYVDNRIMTHSLLQLSSLENGDQLKQHPRSEVDIIALYASLGRLLQDQMDATLQFTYCEIGERQSVPAWNFRKDLLKLFLIGTHPIDTRMFKVISMYKEIDAAGALLMGPIDLQYREFLKSKQESRQSKRKSRGVKADSSSVDDDSTSYTSNASSLPSLPQISSSNQYMQGNMSSQETSPSSSGRKLEETANINELLADDYGSRRSVIGKL